MIYGIMITTRPKSTLPVTLIRAVALSGFSQKSHTASKARLRPRRQIITPIVWKGSQMTSQS